MCIFPCRPYWGDIAEDNQHDLGEKLDTFLGISDTITVTREDSICSRNKQNANSHSMLYSQNGIDSKSRSKVKKRTACGYKG